MNYKENFFKKVNSNDLKVCILGMGYVGLPLSLTFAEKKIKTVGLDIDKNKINSLNIGKSHINQIKNETIKNQINNNFLEFTTNFEIIKNVDAIIICVPTPLNKLKKPDLSYINNSLESLLPFLKKGQVLSLESTTYPGTTDEVVKPLIEKKGFIIGKDFFIVYSPEREDPGNQNYNPKNIPKVIGGCTQSCRTIGIELYKNVIQTLIPVSSTKTAEMTKLLENIHRSVNISLINELKPLLDKMDIDIYEVINAAATKPFGFVPYYPSVGVGGHCIPIDPFYLSWKARKLGFKTNFIDLADKVNEYMPLYVFNKSKEVLLSKKKIIETCKVLILGISYKKNIDDARESCSIKLLKLFTEKNIKVHYSDPYFDNFPITRNLKLTLKSISLTKENLVTYDIVIIATDHDSFDYALIEQESNLIIDTTGRLKPSKKIFRA